MMDAFYAVYVPKCEDSKSQSRVFGSLQEAKAYTKRHHKEGARFKMFSDQAEARHFATSGEESFSFVKRNGDACSSKEESTRCSYPTPKPLELSRLRWCIESGKSAEYREKVIGNPRLFINDDVDSPRILNAGCRYNAMHIAARHGNWLVCRMIVAFLENTLLLKALNPNRPDHVLEEARTFLFDLYLNAPEKMMNATPLYLACKFGHLAVVRLLVSYKNCLRGCTIGRSPKEVICESAASASAEVKEEMAGWLDNTSSYVPLYREGSSLRVTGAAKLCRPVVDIPATCKKGNNGSSLSGDWSLAAFAGPMSAERANEFYNVWMNKRPKSAQSDNSDLHSLRFKDAHKGMERIGRILAKRFGHPWTEYWHFLDAYCNIASVEGLILFDRYLGLRNEPNTRRLGFAVEPSELDAEYLAARADRNLSIKDAHLDYLQNDEVFYDASCECQFEEHSADHVGEIHCAKMERYYWAPEFVVNAFIYGDEPMKTDYDVYEALNGVPVAPSFLAVQRWYENVSAHSQETMAAWPPVDSPRASAILKKTPNSKVKPTCLF